MITKERAQALKEQLNIYDDTPEIIDMLKEAADAVVGTPQETHRYICMEARVHIQGLFDLAKEMLRLIREEAKEGNNG